MLRLGPVRHFSKSFVTFVIVKKEHTHAILEGEVSEWVSSLMTMWLKIGTAFSIIVQKTILSILYRFHFSLKDNSNTNTTELNCIPTIIFHTLSETGNSDISGFLANTHLSTLGSF